MESDETNSSTLFHPVMAPTMAWQSGPQVTSSRPKLRTIQRHSNDIKALFLYHFWRMRMQFKKLATYMFSSFALLLGINASREIGGAGLAFLYYKTVFSTWPPCWQKHISLQNACTQRQKILFKGGWVHPKACIHTSQSQGYWITTSKSRIDCSARSNKRRIRLRKYLHPSFNRIVLCKDGIMNCPVWQFHDRNHDVL